MPARLRAYTRFLVHEWRDADGTTAAERARATAPAEPALPEPDLPEDLLAAETVGLLYDEVDGFHLFPDYGLVAEAFERPEALTGHHWEAVLDYLEHPDIIPLPLRRLAAQHPDRVDQLFRRVLRRRGFSWQRDGEALLRRYKPGYYREPPMPGITPLGDELARALAPGPVDRRPGRNDPCPCGSGKKFKRCCAA